MQLNTRSSLQALTSAALLLPGLSCTPAAAEEISIQAGHYQEGTRALPGIANVRQGIEVDSLRQDARITLNEDADLNVSYSQDTWSGATPITTAPLVANGNRPILSGSPGHMAVVGASPMLNGRLYVNRQLRPVQLDPATGLPGAVSERLVHTISSASPETRRQFDAKLTRRFDLGALNVGAGVSQERDYQSGFVNLGRRWDFNQQLTSLSAGLSYTHSDTAATFDHDALPYITKTAYRNQIENVGGNSVLHGLRQDWGASLGLVQILDQGSMLDASAAYTRSAGYLSNPYKLMTALFVDPAGLAAASTSVPADMQALLEQRPELRNQWSLGARWIRHVPEYDAALRLGYRYTHDDWGIAAHSFDANWVQPLEGGWTLAPHLRYYSQNAADFYSPYLVSQQAYRKVTADPDGRIVITPFDPGKLPAYFSSDQRLSGFGALSFGLAVSKKLERGISLEAGIETTRNAGALKMGGGGEAPYADFNYTVANVAIKFDLSKVNAKPAATDDAPHDPVHSHSHPGVAIPAGVMFGHGLDTPGEIMVGYRYQYTRDAGPMIQGTSAINDARLTAQACAGKPCYGTPVNMRMHMHMFDIMYGLSERVSLMLMPQYVTMGMESRLIDGASLIPADTHVHTGQQETGGVGDTALHALFKLQDSPRGLWWLALGVSAPTGDSAARLRRSHQQDPGYTHYGMQTGSGTWDFKPALTVQGQNGNWGWGGQLSATLPLQNRNPEGYALGKSGQATAWLSRPLNPWLAATVRGVYTAQAPISGQYSGEHPQTSPPDFPENYGGRYTDLGLGLSTRPSFLNGATLGLEWLRPLRTEVNGYQLTREGSLTASWKYHF